MKYAIDTEFVDTPTCSALISLAIVAEDGRSLYFEFDFPEEELTPWLKENVLPHLIDAGFHDQYEAGLQIRRFIGDDVSPEFWCYFASYDWYFFCRLFGGFMQMPKHWPQRPRELADFVNEVPNIAGAEHSALNDAVSIMAVVKRLKQFPYVTR
jgi:hypothetical protein